MAYRVTSPGRGGYQIPSSPEGTYQSLASKYANDFRRALRQEEQNELNLKIIAWQNGDISWEELDSYLEDRLGGAKEGSSEKVNLLETRSTLRQRKQEMFEAEQAEIASNMRTQLVEKMGEGGLTDKEQLEIVQAIKNKVDENSDTYADLVSEEAQLKTRIAESQRSAASGTAKRSALTEYRETRATVLQEINQNELAYQRGQISGMERDQRNLDASRELVGGLRDLQAAGASVPEDEIETATNLLSTHKNLISLRERGMVADALTADNEVTTVATNNRNFGREFVVDSSGNLKLGESADIGGVWQDPTTGFYGVAGEEVPQYESRGEAMRAAQEKGVLSFEAVVPTEDGQTRLMTMAKDPNTGAFYNVDDPTQAYAEVPQTTEQAEMARYEGLPENWRDDQEIINWVGKQQQRFGQTDEVDLTFDVPEVTPMDETTRDRRGLFQRIGEFDMPDIPEAEEIERTFEPAREFTREAAEDVGEFGKRAFETAKKAGTEGIQAGPLSVKPAFGMPDIKIGKFDVPEFNVPTFKRFTSKLTGGGQAMKTGGPKPVSTRQEPTGPRGLVGRAKQFGQKLLGTVKDVF